MQIMHFQCCCLKQAVAILLEMSKHGSCSQKKEKQKPHSDIKALKWQTHKFCKKNDFL